MIRTTGIGSWLFVLLPAVWGGLGAVRPSCGQMAPELAQNEEQERALLAVAGEGFKVRRTRHFAIAYDTPYDTLLAFEGRLEGTYNSIHRFADKENLIASAPDGKLRVVLFATPDGYHDACAEHRISAEAAGGFYAQAPNMSFFLDALARPDFAEWTAEIDRLQAEVAARKGDGDATARAERDALLRRANSLRMQRDAAVERSNRLIVQHEAAHQLLFNLGVHRRGTRQPEWLVEGMACQFEVPQTPSESGLKKVNMIRLADFREAFGIAPSAAPVKPGRYRQAFDDERMPRLRELVAGEVPMAVPGPQGAYRYAEAWALVHYLHREQADRFREYLRQLARRMPGEPMTPAAELAQFETVFGEIDEEFEDRFVNYILGRTFRPEALDP